MAFYHRCILKACIATEDRQAGTLAQHIWHSRSQFREWRQQATDLPDRGMHRNRCQLATVEAKEWTVKA